MSALPIRSGILMAALLLTGGTVQTTATISGRVTDASGAPLANVTVTAPRIDDGDVESARSARSTVTDDLGEYELRGLEPGEYWIVVPADHSTVATNLNPSWRTLVPASAPDDAGARTSEDGRFMWSPSIDVEPPPGPEGRATVFVTTGYPSTADRAGYTRLRVDAGDALPDIDIVMATAPRVRVRGIALGADGPLQGVRVRLRRAGVPWYDEVVQAVSHDDGHFEFLSAPPGVYELHAFRVPGDGHVIRPDPDGYWLQDSLTIGDQDVTDLTLRLTPGVTVRARVELAQALRGPRLPVRLEPTTVSHPMAFAGGDQEFVDGVLVARGLAPGKYMFLPGQNQSIEAVHIEGRDATGEALTVEREDIDDVVVTLGTATNGVRGSVLVPDDVSLDNVRVVILPIDPDLRVSARANPTMRRIRVESDRTYVLENLMPGLYFIAAVNQGLVRDLWAPGVIDRVAAVADTITVARGQALTHNLVVRR